MSRLTIAAQVIKDNVSAQDVGTVLGLEIRNGRCKCPLHGGNDYNCVLYKGNRGFYCHVCKSGGDVIKFIQEYHGMNFKDAVLWFDGTFNLGLELEKPIDPEKQRQAEIAIQRRKRQHELEEWKNRRQFDLMLMADRIVERLEETRDEYRPRTYGDCDERFCMAVKLLPEARRFAEDCEMDCNRKGE